MSMACTPLMCKDHVSSKLCSRALSHAKLLNEAVLDHSSTATRIGRCGVLCVRVRHLVRLHQRMIPVPLLGLFRAVRWQRGL